jgi:hypothetical protein
MNDELNTNEMKSTIRRYCNSYTRVDLKTTGGLIEGAVISSISDEFFYAETDANGRSHKIWYQNMEALIVL